MTALSALVAGSRIVALRAAIAAGLRAQFPEIDVTEHPGKLDFADVLAKDNFRCPAAAVAVTRVRPDARLSEEPEYVADVTIYVVAEDMTLGTPALLVKRDEVAWAIALEICAVALGSGSRWGLQDIAHPEDVDARPLFTSTTYERGTVYFAVTWRQRLFATASTSWSDGDAP